MSQRLKFTVHEYGEVTGNVNESRVIQQLRIFHWTVRPKESWERVVFLCSHETLAQCGDSSFTVRVVQLVASVLISTMSCHARLESYQSTRDTCLTHHNHNHHNHHNHHRCFMSLCRRWCGSTDDRILLFVAADCGAARRHSSSWWWRLRF